MDEFGGLKSPFSSKTIHFNVLTAAMWPFLPDGFRKHEYAQAALLAWLTIGNVVLRMLTSKAIAVIAKRREKPCDSSTKTTSGTSSGSGSSSASSSPS